MQHLTPFALNRNLPWQIYASRSKRFGLSHDNSHLPPGDAPAIPTPRPTAANDGVLHDSNRMRRPRDVPRSNPDEPVTSPRHRRLRPIATLHADTVVPAEKGHASSRRAKIPTGVRQEVAKHMDLGVVASTSRTLRQDHKWGDHNCGDAVQWEDTSVINWANTQERD